MGTTHYHDSQISKKIKSICRTWTRGDSEQLRMSSPIWNFFRNSTGNLLNNVITLLPHIDGRRKLHSYLNLPLYSWILFVTRFRSFLSIILLKNTLNKSFFKLNENTVLRFKQRINLRLIIKSQFIKRTKVIK